MSTEDANLRRDFTSQLNSLWRADEIAAIVTVGADVQRLVISAHRQECLRHLAVTGPQQSAKAFAACNLVVERIFVVRVDSLVTQPLLISLAVIIRQVLSHSVAPRTLAEKDHSLHAFGFQRTKEPFDVSVQVRTPTWQANRLNTSVSEQFPE